MEIHRVLILTGNRIAVPGSVLCRAAQPKSWQRIPRFTTPIQQRHQSDLSPKPNGLLDDDSTVNVGERATDSNSASSTNASADTGKTQLEVLSAAFKRWGKTQMNKHTEEQVNEMLATGPPRSNTLRNSQLPGESDPHSVLHIDFDQPDSAVGRFDNPYSARQTIETPLVRWENGVRSMDTSLHMGIKSGRQMEVIQTNPADLGAKLNLLGALVSRNKIKQAMMVQRFHERPGLKRKRLKRERWRKRFAGSFASICKRATSLASQGW